MAVIEFDPKASLAERKAAIEAQIAALDATEPEDMECEEYEAWADAHEELEDLLDDILDLMDEA